MVGLPSKSLPTTSVVGQFFKPCQCDATAEAVSDQIPVLGLVPNRARDSPRFVGPDSDSRSDPLH